MSSTSRWTIIDARQGIPSLVSLIGALEVDAAGRLSLEGARWDLYWQQALDGDQPWGTIQGSILGIPSRNPAFTADMALEAPNLFWKKQTSGGPVRVLSEGYDVNDGAEYNLDEQEYYEHLLRGTANLSVKYMTGTEFADWDDYCCRVLASSMACRTDRRFGLPSSRRGNNRRVGSRAPDWQSSSSVER